VLDRVAAAVALLLLSPLLAGLALAVRWSSPGPVLFRQRRIGRDGRDFELLKFRSTRRLQEAVTGPRKLVALGPDVAPGGVEGADRRTAVGRLMRRTPMDELPQLLNVIRGEMTLVGPRPERRGQTSLADRVEWDNHYIENWSLGLDLKILVMTVAAVLRRAE
jgi:lipopolysaccharide/colanic/teichoic acid biosynthesis glycosyltransferase